jgi:hypothetical protein
LVGIRRDGNPVSEEERERCRNARPLVAVDERLRLRDVEGICRSDVK